MHLELDEEQLEVLDELVNMQIARLGSEIRHTDNREYRRALAHKRDVLRAMSSSLRDLIAPSASSV